jgi:hypothetical protein
VPARLQLIAPPRRADHRTQTLPPSHTGVKGSLAEEARQVISGSGAAAASQPASDALVDDDELAALVKEPDRPHERVARRGPFSGVRVDVHGPETGEAVVRVAVADDLSAPRQEHLASSIRTGRAGADPWAGSPRGRGRQVVEAGTSFAQGTAGCSSATGASRETAKLDHDSVRADDAAQRKVAARGLAGDFPGPVDEDDPSDPVRDLRDRVSRENAGVAHRGGCLAFGARVLCARVSVS